MQRNITYLKGGHYLVGAALEADEALPVRRVEGVEGAGLAAVALPPAVEIRATVVR